MVMALSEGTAICLVIGIAFLLTGVFKLQNKRDSEAKQQAAAVAQQQAVRSAALAEPPMDGETQREILEAQLEALHRDEWCRKFEEEEIKNHAKQKMYQYAIQKREMMLEDAQAYLRELKMRRIELQRRLFLDERYANAAQWNLPGPQLEVLDNGSIVEYPHEY